MRGKLGSLEVDLLVLILFCCKSTVVYGGWVTDLQNVLIFLAMDITGFLQGTQDAVEDFQHFIPFLQ